MKSLCHNVSVLICLTLFGLAAQARAADTPAPPHADVIAHKTTIHGHTLVDNYFWLRERGDEKVLAYLNAENSYTEAMTRDTQALRAKLFDEFKARIKQSDLSVPARDGDYYYYTRTERGKQYRIYCRKHGSLDADEQVLLDANKMAGGRDFFRIGAYEVSPNARLLAYSVDTSGAEKYALFVKNLDSGEVLAERIENISDVVWANDNKTLFYTTLDAARRPFKLFRHTLGAAQETDELIYHESDERFFVGISRTRSDKYLLMDLGSSITSEVRFLDANQPGGEFKIVQPRVQGMEYSVEHHGDRFFITTNRDAVNFKLVETPVAQPSMDHWRDLIAHRDNVKIDGVDAFKDYLVVYTRERGMRAMHVRDLHSGASHRVAFPEAAYTFYPAANPEFDTRTLRFSYTSLVTPNSVYDYNMDTRSRELLKRQEVLGGYDPQNYATARTFATASDGTRVPISLVHRKGLTRDGKSPMLLYGYGSYGISIDPRFRSTVISLLDRGFVFAVANIRGGGEMGRMWYENGKFLHKKNTFTDFIACAEHLIAEKYTNPEKLAIMGGSAGGLLMGAVANMRPDLFKVVVAQVPFVDVINTMLDASIPLTVTEYEEWGNPADDKYFDYMLSYSPYDNVRAQRYPNMLITAGLNDPRVQYWEPAKWTAKLRALKTDDNVLLLKTNMGAGHGGASGRYDRLKETAFSYAFILDMLDVDD